MSPTSPQKTVALPILYQAKKIPPPSLPPYIVIQKEKRQPGLFSFCITIILAISMLLPLNTCTKNT